MALFQSVQDSGTPIINFGQNAWTQRVLAPISIFCWAYSTVDITTIANAGVLVANMNSVEACAGWGSIAFEADGVGTNRNMAVQMASWGTPGSATHGQWEFDTAQDTNVWHSHLVTYSYANLTDVPAYYLDGVAKPIVDTVHPPSGSLITGYNIDYTLGNGLSTDNDSLPGAIAYAAVWNAMLTPIEAELLAAGCAPSMIRPDQLVFYCPCSGPAQALDLGRAQLGMASITGTWQPADDPWVSPLPARRETPITFSPLSLPLPYRRPNLPLYRR